MIGQIKIQEKLNTVTIDDFPKSLILQGESGCGKHLLCSLLEEKFVDYSFIYVKDKITYEFIEDVYLSLVPSFYIIDSNRLSDREQNILLKVFEEPPKNVWVIILTTTSAKIIPTILGRAVVWVFEPYTKDELRQFLGENDESLLEFVTTPGQVLGLTNTDINEINKLCNLIIDKIGVASVSNTLSLSNRFKFNNSKKNNEDGIEFSVFFKMLRASLVERIKADIHIQYVDMYQLTNEVLHSLSVPNVNDRMIFENYLLRLKYIR